MGGVLGGGWGGVTHSLPVKIRGLLLLMLFSKEKDFLNPEAHLMSFPPL